MILQLNSDLQENKNKTAMQTFSTARMELTPKAEALDFIRRNFVTTEKQV